MHFTHLSPLSVFRGVKISVSEERTGCLYGAPFSDLDSFVFYPGGVLCPFFGVGLSCSFPVAAFVESGSFGGSCILRLFRVHDCPATERPGLFYCL